ncbi:hypothetical protein D1816_02265 [Aquimarina sp. AD10]|uniref:hypothetical protein n=1 Tax=Aquimarina sp. AD10 TaxID=1714849 RepID=UPI000E4B2833|nr:hypothetical protein [Aquimarina sp. AD10]AXT59219.1 hypothetical protein D1816_02265 [Aquimarina sp. AD10]RKM92709.1 hypothetical protein D7033_20840 [Aquimarina sp. AD10]
MTESIDELKQTLKSIILSGPLKEINFYQVNDNFFELSNEGIWIIDAGIELKFPSGIISTAWNSKLECYVMENKSVETIYGQDNLYQLDNKNISELKKYVGLNVVNSSFKSMEFEYVVDYTMRMEKEERFVELILEFQNKSKIQIAFIHYTLEENRRPSNFSFSIITELLISTEKIVEIKNVG